MAVTEDSDVFPSRRKFVSTTSRIAAGAALGSLGVSACGDSPLPSSSSEDLEAVITGSTETVQLPAIGTAVQRTLSGATSRGNIQRFTWTVITDPADILKAIVSAKAWSSDAIKFAAV